MVELYLHSPNTPSWRGAQLKAQGQLYFLALYFNIHTDLGSYAIKQVLFSADEA
jgi:hypothetical protein